MQHYQLDGVFQRNFYLTPLLSPFKELFVFMVFVLTHKRQLIRKSETGLKKVPLLIIFGLIISFSAGSVFVFTFRQFSCYCLSLVVLFFLCKEYLFH